MLTNNKMECLTVSSCVTPCVFILMIYIITAILFRRQKLYIMASKFRGPPCLPIIGNAHLFMCNAEEVLEVFDDLEKLYLPPFRAWVVHRLIFGVTDPQQIKAICLSPKALEKSEFYGFVRPWIGTGLLTAPAAKWRVHRKLIAPTFYVEILQSFVEIFATQAAKTVANMERKIDGPEFQVSEYVGHYALMTICETTMGVNLETEMNSNIREYTEATKKVMEIATHRMMRPWLYPDFVFARTHLGKVQQKHIKFLHNFTDKVIQRKKKEFLERRSPMNSNDHDTAECDPNPQRKVFLDQLLNLSHGSEALTDVELREEVDTLMAAGSDTTAAVSSYVMLMLASHPDIQERVYEELCGIHEDHDGEELNITGQNLRRMTYLEQVIKETMRIFPVAPYMMRKVTDDLDIGGYILPKGSEVVVGIRNVHRNEKYWPDPMKFDPDRFLPEQVAKRDPYAYMPFSGGVRNCIGAKYGMLSMKTLMATILWKYVLKKDNIVPLEDIRLKTEFVLRTVEPITIRIEDRKQIMACN